MSDDLVERVARAIENSLLTTQLRDAFEHPYTAEARAAIAVCMEEAAKVCIAVSTDALTKVGREHEPFMRATAEDCAAAIRAMIKEPT